MGPLDQGVEPTKTDKAVNGVKPQRIDQIKVEEDVHGCGIRADPKVNQGVVPKELEKVGKEQLKKEPANTIDKDGTPVVPIEEEGAAVDIQKSAKQKRGKNKDGQQRTFPEPLEEEKSQKQDGERSVLKKEPANIIDKDGKQAGSIEEDGTAVNIQKSAKQKRGKNKGGQQRSFPELLEEAQGQKVGKEQSEQV